jgi:hypothetical protein
VVFVPVAYPSVKGMPTVDRHAVLAFGDDGSEFFQFLVHYRDSVSFLDSRLLDVDECHVLVGITGGGGKYG